jgi:hypothetical protein
VGESEFLRVLGRVEVVVEGVSRAAFDVLEGLQDSGPAVRDRQCSSVPRGARARIGRTRWAEHGVAGIERAQVEFGVGAGADESEEVFEDLGHEIPGGPSVESEALTLEHADAPAEAGVLLEQVDRVPFAGEEDRRGQPGGSPADDTGARAAAGSRADPPVHFRPSRAAVMSA